MNALVTDGTAAVRYQSSFPAAVTKNVVVVVLWMCINYMNVDLIYIFHKHQIFYTNPRYILLIHLVINDMIQLTLSVIMFVFSTTVYAVNAAVCCVLVLLAVFTTENTPLNLACMTLECYVAVCHPLHHRQICSIRRTLTLIGLIWVTSILSALPELFITLATEPLSFFQTTIFCIRQTVFPHSISVQKRDITYTVFQVLVWLIMFYCYFRIVFTSKTASKDAQKARNTTLLRRFHLLLCMATYAAPQLLIIVQQQLPHLFTDTNFAFYVIVQVLPRSISPVIYGIRDNSFRKYLQKYVSCEAINN